MTHRMEDKRDVMLKKLCKAVRDFISTSSLPDTEAISEKIGTLEDIIEEIESHHKPSYSALWDGCVGAWVPYLDSSIEGIPDGWELVGIGRGKIGDHRLGADGEIVECSSEWSNTNNVIIRKVEKPKTYRPFENAAEFEPHRNRWLMHPSEPDKRFKPGDYNNEGVWGLDRRKYSFAHLFESGTQFDDGTPFGVEVSE